jgi:tRNA pseudouridine38-40 synthase
MPRYVLRVEYDGAPFVGWQRQAEGLSIQQVIEEAAAQLAGGAPVEAAAAGRTDAGVHAAAQVVQIDLAREIDPGTLRDALNFHMRAHPVSVLAAGIAPEGFHARFSATGRAYRYRILDRRAPPALDRGRVWHIPRPLDAEAMAAAARVLVGRHDFSSFRAASCQASGPVRTLDRLDVSRAGEGIVIEAAARSFLHHQVRNIAGTLKRVGEGTWTEDDVARILAAADRRLAGQTAPPEGLTLTAVTYPEGLCPV